MTHELVALTRFGERLTRQLDAGSIGRADRKGTNMRRLIPILLLVGALSACSGGPEVETVESAAPVGAAPTSASPSPSPTPDSPSASDAAQQYLAAFASDNPAEMEKMVRLSEPGSAAHAYGLHQKALSEANQAGGQVTGPQVLTAEGDTIKLCSGTGTGTTDCAVYSDFQALPNGKLVAFQVNDTPIETRLLPAGDRAPVAAGGVSLRLISAYRGIQSDLLIITLEASSASDSEATFATYDADYLGPTGKQVKVAQAVGLTDLQPGATTTMAVAVPAAELGGTLTVEVFTSSDFSDLAVLKIPLQ